MLEKGMEGVVLVTLLVVLARGVFANWTLLRVGFIGTPLVILFVDRADITVKLGLLVRCKGYNFKLYSRGFAKPNTLQLKIYTTFYSKTIIIIQRSELSKT